MKSRILVLLLTFWMVTGAQAVSRPEVRFKANGAVIGCASGATRVYFDGPFATVDNATSYHFDGIVFSGSNIYEHSVGSITGASLNNPALSWSFDAANTGGRANASFPLPNDTPYSLRFVLSDSSGRSAWVAIVNISKCNGGVITQLVDYPYSAASAATLEVVVDGPPDNRLNWRHGDANIGIIYPGQDDRLDLYCHDEKVYISSFVTPLMLEPYTDRLPDQPVVLAQRCFVTAYLLTDGIIQFNLGPDIEGKWYEVMLDSLTDREIKSIGHDPNNPYSP